MSLEHIVMGTVEALVTLVRIFTFLRDNLKNNFKSAVKIEISHWGIVGREICTTDWQTSFGFRPFSQARRKDTTKSKQYDWTTIERNIDEIVKEVGDSVVAEFNIEYDVSGGIYSGIVQRFLKDKPNCWALAP